MKQFCVYLTTYFGNKLPMFYIGSTSVANIELGYHGSVASRDFTNHWKNELKQNSHLFKTKVVSYHKTRQEAYDQEEKFQRSLNVVKNPLYTNASIANKHFSRHGIPTSEETKTKISAKLSGGVLNDDTKSKISATCLGKKKSEETKEKMSKSKLGYSHSVEARAKMAKSKTGTKRSKESIEKTRVANIGAKRSEQGCSNIAAARHESVKRGKGCHKIKIGECIFSSKKEAKLMLVLHDRVLCRMIASGEAEILKTPCLNV